MSSRAKIAIPARAKILMLSRAKILMPSRTAFYPLFNAFVINSFPVPLGSIPELPADSCGEIKASEGAQAVSGNFWLDPTRSGNSILVRCDMETGSK